MRQLYGMFFILLFGLSGCGKQSAGDPLKKKSKKGTHVPTLRQFQAKIDGVECALCAQDMIDLFKDLDGVQLVDFVTRGTDYEAGYLRFCYDVSKENFDLIALDNKILEEGFELTSITGPFHIEPFNYNGKQFIVFNEELALPMKFGHDFNTLRTLVHNYADIRFAEGDIVRQEGQNKFAFVLQHA